MMAAHRISMVQRLSGLLQGLAEVPADLERPITMLSMDSRGMQPGGLFLACAGTGRHGLEFLEEAVNSGAVAVAWEPDRGWDDARVEPLARKHGVLMLAVPGLGQQVSHIAGRFYGDPSHALFVAGYTGTNGKTSSTQFLARVLGSEAPCGIIGTLGSGFPGVLSPGTHTTPDPVELQRTLAEFRLQGAQAVAMEVSSHALDQGRVAAIHFDVAVFTNLSRDHLDYHGDMERYAAAKLRLFQHPGVGCGVLNLDDPFGRELLHHLPAGVRAIGYGLQPPEELPARLDEWIWARGIEPGSDGMRIRVQTSQGDGEFHSTLLGRFNVSNLLSVLGVLLYRGVALEEALRRLAKLETVPGRMERFGGGGQPLVVVDYAHTPDALEQALRAGREHARGRLICVFGCGGDRDRGKRPQMGGIAERLADLVIVTDDNPRTEDGDRIVADILAGMDQPHRVRVERDRTRAIREAVTAGEPGDLVLVCGKGHEDYQLVGGRRLHFCDREQVRAALREGAA